MEGSKGEAAFDALGLNPQLLINDVLNMVDDVVDAAFNFFHQEAAKILGFGDDGCSKNIEDLSRGISSLRFLVEAALDKQLNIWEKYCLNHCFSVPKGFASFKNQISSGSQSVHPELHDEQLDLQLEALRTKLVEARNKNAVLQREILSLEKQSRYDAAIVETMQLFEQNSMPQIFKDIEEATSKLQKEMQEAMVCMKDDAESRGLIKINMLKERVKMQDEDLFTKLEEIQDVVKILRTM